MRNQNPFLSSSAATWPLPSSEGCRPLHCCRWILVGRMSWGHIGNRRGDPWCGRPATYARRQTNVSSSPSSTSPTAYQCQKTNVRTCAGQLRAPPKHAFPPWCKRLPHLQCLTPNPSHSFAYMPAWTVATEVRLP